MKASKLTLLPESQLHTHIYIWWLTEVLITPCMQTKQCRGPLLHLKFLGLLFTVRVGQSPIHKVYKQYFWQGNHQIHGHIWCKYTVLANPIYSAGGVPCSACPFSPVLVLAVLQHSIGVLAAIPVLACHRGCRWYKSGVSLQTASLPKRCA
jgi:hypothetical protein